MSSDVNVFGNLTFPCPHQVAAPPFSKTFTLESVLENLRFRHTPFSIVLVWMLSKNVQKSMRFQTKTH